MADIHRQSRPTSTPAGYTALLLHVAVEEWQMFARQNNDPINSVPQVLKTLQVPLQRCRLKWLRETVTAVPIARDGTAHWPLTGMLLLNAALGTVKMLHYL